MHTHTQILTHTCSCLCAIKYAYLYKAATCVERKLWTELKVRNLQGVEEDKEDVEMLVVS